MPIFTNEEGGGKEVETIIGSSVKVEGNFKSEGNVTVNGIVEGSLSTNRDLKVGPRAKMKAEVSAKNLFLRGEIRGNVTVHEKAQLLSGARILGNLQTKSLIVEEGAFLNGKCMMSSEEKAPETSNDSKKSVK